MPERGSCFLFGPRQTGKTTLVTGLLPERSWTINLMRSDAALRYQKDPSLFRREVEEKIRGGCGTFFVDEVQKVPDLLDEVQDLHDRTRARFLLTGSSARKLRRGGANLLGGRALTRHLHPLTLQELGNAFDLDRALRFGTLPPVVGMSDADAADFLRSYVDTYLREEIQAEAIVRNLGGFARFLDVAAAQSGDLLNYSSVGRDASLATRTVQEYFQILEETLVGFRLEAWRKSPRGRLVGHSRFYLFDPGVVNAIVGRLTAPPDPAAKGRLFEQWVVLECARLIDYARSEARLYFWRTNHGAEVDLLVEKHGRLKVAVEIKAKSHVVSADLTGLRSFSEAHPDVPMRAVALVPEPYRIGATRVLPLPEFLSELTGWV